MSFVAIVQKSYPREGRTQSTYINIVRNIRLLDSSLADWIAANANHPWNDPEYVEFIVELTDAQTLLLRDDRFHDGVPSQPKWQQRTTGTGSATELGSWVDPTNSSTAWQADVPISDDRWILRVFDGNPLGVGVHVARQQLDEDLGVGQSIIFFRLFNPDGTPSDRTELDSKVKIGKTRMILSFTNGVAMFAVKTDRPGVAELHASDAYRIDGPNNEKEFIAEVFGLALPLNE